jgi:CDP-diacylglycerol--glycerol-3-phosphate 3-phosphatidyltransferase
LWGQDKKQSLQQLRIIYLFKPKSPHAFYSEANLLTLLRLVFSLYFFILAILKSNPKYNFIGLAVHLIGDFIDGFYARTFKQETILGAEIDIIADRLEAIFFYVNFIYFRPTLFLPVAIYLVDYAFVDFYLSYQFIKYDIISPNYFYKVDRTVHILNYSPVGKFCNSTMFVLMLIFLPQYPIIPGLFASGLNAVKLFSIYWLNSRHKEGESQRVLQV